MKSYHFQCACAKIARKAGLGISPDSIDSIRAYVCRNTQLQDKTYRTTLSVVWLCEILAGRSWFPANGTILPQQEV
jgi:hypothetical protein